MTSALVCGQWSLPVPDPTDDSQQWFLDWATKSPREVSKHITQGYHALLALKEHDPDADYSRVTELFGGLGCQTLMVRHLIQPVQQVAYENHPAAAAHLRTVLAGSNSIVTEGDSYALPLPPSDLIMADFGDLTARSAPSKHRLLLDRIFHSHPKAVVLTDVAGPRLWGNRKVYEMLLGVDCRTYASYLQGLSAWFTQEYSYGTIAIFYHHWSAILVLVPGSASAVPQHAPSEPTGLTLTKEHS